MVALVANTGQILILAGTCNQVDKGFGDLVSKFKF